LLLVPAVTVALAVQGLMLPFELEQLIITGGVFAALSMGATVRGITTPAAASSPMASAMTEAARMRAIFVDMERSERTGVGCAPLQVAFRSVRRG
jgi:hypothetical protein